MSANMRMCFEMLKTSLSKDKVEIMLHSSRKNTVQAHFVKKEKSWEVASKHSSVA